MKATARPPRREVTPVGSHRSPAAATGTSRRRLPLWKRFLDLSLIIAASPLWAPLMLGIGATIKILSPGPVLFRQARIGRDGIPFVCLKFRTMHQGADTTGHESHLKALMRSNRPMTKLDEEDPRLIPLARLFRSTGLDELPQLFNVLRGDMSLVGPRPCTPEEYRIYSERERRRLQVQPGLTGLWQVNGKNHTTFARMIDLDLAYAQTLSPWLDLAIMLRTPAVLLQQLAETMVSRVKRTLLSFDEPPRPPTQPPAPRNASTQDGLHPGRPAGVASRVFYRQ